MFALESSPFTALVMTISFLGCNALLCSCEQQGSRRRSAVSILWHLQLRGVGGFDTDTPVSCIPEDVPSAGGCRA